MISIKTPQEIILMREAGRILSSIRKQLIKNLQVGISSEKLDMIAYDLIKQHGVVSAFKGYRGYGGYTCISVNEEVVHGLPSHKHIFKLGDTVSIDIGIRYKDYFADSAWTYSLGQI